jgi:catechol 2,3-dioxygenase-like lactoylglutathione lyase family enzyme
LLTQSVFFENAGSRSLANRLVSLASHETGDGRARFACTLDSRVRDPRKTIVSILEIDHVQLAMPAGREDDARAFYSGILGLSEVPKPARLAKRGGVWFESGSVKIHLGVEKDFRASEKAHVGLVARDLAELLSRCEAAGVRIVSDEPLETPDGPRAHAYVFDPFGNRIEILERLPL